MKPPKFNPPRADSGYVFVCTCGCRWGEGTRYGDREVEIKECAPCALKRTEKAESDRKKHQANADAYYAKNQKRLLQRRLERRQQMVDL